ncbi:MAG: ascorbate-dependent monooxygenase [Gemmataceae bacterium]
MFDCLAGVLAVLSLVGPMAGVEAAVTPTFNKDVAPILFKHCASCHRPGEIGPFSLLEYKDASKRAAFLAKVTSENRMPPWSPEPGFGHFKDERRLTDSEKSILQAWAKAGAPEGDPDQLPPKPAFESGWVLGKPDLVVELPKEFTVPASGPDVYQCFVIPLPVTRDEAVVAVDFQPGNAKVVHHAILYLDSDGQGRAKADPVTRSFPSFGGPGIRPTGNIGAWAPGIRPIQLPEGTGRYLKKGSDLVLQIHYHPSGKEEKDKSRVGIYFSKTPIRNYVGAVGIRTRQWALRIPPDESQFTLVDQSEPLPVAAKAIGILPHMHYLGKEMKVDAKLPDGSEIPLIWIKDWDFNWQGIYGYREPIDLPKGTVIRMRAVFDNSTANPRNPSSPPIRVTWGEQTQDEMCICGVQVVTDNKKDLKQVMDMLHGDLGMILGGGGMPEDDETRSLGMARNKKIERLILWEYDADKDGMISKEELELVPKSNRERVTLMARVMGKLK